jgi:hypothetical protein
MQITISNNSKLNTAPSAIKVNNINNIGNVTLAANAEFLNRLSVTNINRVGRINFGGFSSAFGSANNINLGDLLDVNTTGHAEGDVLVFNANTGFYDVKVLPRVDGLNTVIQIRRSTVASAPANLNVGELFYSYTSNTLFIGNAANGVMNVGGRFYTNLLDTASFANSANSLVLRSSNGSIQVQQLDIFNSPSANTHAATKEYVDIAFQAGVANIALNSLYDVDIGGTGVSQANKILVGNGAGFYVGTLVTGNVSLSGSGVVTINPGNVTNAMLEGGITNNKLQNSNVTIVSGPGLSNGGIVALGSSITIDVNAGDGLSNANGNLRVDSTVVRTDRPQTLNGSSYTFSTPVNFNGGISVTGTLTFGGNTVATQANLTLAHNQANAAYAQANAAFDAANNNQVTVVANNGLAINVSDVLSTVYNTTISDGVQSIAVGGAPAQDASNWRSKNIVEVLDTILFPDIDPTYTNPTISLSASINGTREIGETISQVLNSSGNKNDANTFTQIQFVRGITVLFSNSSLVASSISNIPNQFGYTNPNNPNFSYSGSYTDTFTVVSGVTEWYARGSYNAGVAKKNNKGVNDTRTPAVRNVNAPQAACTTFNSAATSIEGIYPYFWGVSSTQPTAASIASAIAAGTTNKVLASATGTVTVTFNASSEYVWLAHIGTATSKTKWYNTALNNGDIGAGQFILSPVNQNVNSPNGYWSGQSFKIYISGFATTTSGSIEFRNS